MADRRLCLREAGRLLALYLATTEYLAGLRKSEIRKEALTQCMIAASVPKQAASSEIVSFLDGIETDLWNARNILNSFGTHKHSLLHDSPLIGGGATGNSVDCRLILLDAIERINALIDGEKPASPSPLQRVSRWHAELAGVHLLYPFTQPRRQGVLSEEEQNVVSILTQSQIHAMDKSDAPVKPKANYFEQRLVPLRPIMDRQRELARAKPKPEAMIYRVIHRTADDLQRQVKLMT